MRFCIDIDGTLCETIGADYESSTPIPKAIELVQNLRKSGHYIILFTARGTLTGKSWLELTKSQMSSWGVPYDELIMGKPAADIYIDDKALPADIWRQLP
jgi:ribonucleotide monophosphatase NagD (HAD superfamily)